MGGGVSGRIFPLRNFSLGKGIFYGENLELTHHLQPNSLRISFGREK